MAKQQTGAAWQEVKGGYRKIKKFLDSDGPLPWIVNLVIAFIVIKFIVYPVLGWLFGTSLPIVAVVSSSMDHDAIDGIVCGKRVADYDGSLEHFWRECGAWYEQRGISKEEFREYSFKNGFSKGDIMVVLGESRSSLKQGDILIFQAKENYPIIHRIINISTDGTYATKGDHNAEQIADYVLVDSMGRASRCERNGELASCAVGKPVSASTPGAIAIVDETNIQQEQLIGKAVLKIPWLGYIKIWFTDLVVWFANLI